MRLVFVAGWMRSGTTVLAELVGSCPGALAVGELTTMWPTLERDEPCSCGEPVRSCPVWGAVAVAVAERHDVGPGRGTSYTEVDELVSRVLRMKRLPELWRLRARRPQDLPADVRRLVEVVGTVLQVVTETTGARPLVDSSKRPTALLLFSLIPGVQVTPLHLVRDPRAVAFSESRQREWAGVRAALAPPSRSILRSAVAWAVTTVLSHLVGRRFPGYQLLRYEKLAARPRETMAEVASGLGLPAPPFESADSLTLAPSHVVNGNPSRFGGRSRTVAADERWRSELPRSERLAVGVITAPVRLAVRLRAR